MRLNLIILFRFVALCSFCLSSVALRGQAPLVSDAVVIPEAGDAILLDWRIDAAERALRSGLPGLAESGFRAALTSPILDAEEADGLRVRLGAALIAQQRYAEARAEFELVGDTGRDSRFYLYQAIAYYGNGKQVNREQFTASLKQVKEVELGPHDQAWWYFAKALRAELWGNTEQITTTLEGAVRSASTDAQRAFFKSLVFRQKLFETPSSDVVAAEIRAQLERFSGQAAAYPYAREYAAILYNVGRTEDAIEVIDTQRLNNKNLGNREREQLLLLKGVISGPESVRGQEALQQLVRSGKTRDVSLVALQLLARVPDAETSGLTEFLNQMDARAEPHPLLGEIYYIRSQLALARAAKALEGESPDYDLARQETERAEKDAKDLLEKFPGLAQINSVYRLLAYAALQRTSPQYRAAAAFLIQLRDQTELPAERALLNRLIGDCYFLNNDYDNAVDFYAAAHSRAIDSDEAGSLFLRLVTAEVRAGKVESALQHIDEADFSGSVSVADRWRAEWNVAQALKADGQLEVALSRVRLLLAGSFADVPTSLDLRLLWLEAYLSFMAGEQEGLADRVAALLKRVESLPMSIFDETEAKLLITEILLLQAKIFIRTGSADEGMAVLERLRIGYATSSAAQRSYLIESDYHASVNDFKAAQETLAKLASVYPDSLLAPQALFEAAIYCERRGTEFYEEAVRLHNDVAVNYPADDLVFSARLKQGDLLRKVNDFVGAQIVYENLITSYPTHLRRYIPELSRVDCMLALAKNNEEQLNDVLLSLDRLMDIPNLPLDFQAEAGYKWGFTLLKQNEPAQAKAVFMMIASRFLLDGEQAVKLDVAGRYWMSRSLLALGEILEEEGELVEARRVYRKMVAYNLPGRNLALDRANTIQVLEDGAPQ